MNCVSVPGVIVCGGSNRWHRALRDCTVCRKRTRFVIEIVGLYFGPSVQCTRCGSMWDEDGSERELTESSIAEAKDRWTRAMPHKEWVAMDRKKEREHRAYIDSIHIDIEV